MKKLYRSKTDRQISGVCGGIANYFNIDATIIRLVWVFISIASTGIPGVLIYFVCALVIPEEPDFYDATGYDYTNRE